MATVHPTLTAAVRCGLPAELLGALLAVHVGPGSVGELAAAIRRTDRSASRLLRDLRALGFVTRHGLHLSPAPPVSSPMFRGGRLVRCAGCRVALAQRGNTGERCGPCAQWARRDLSWWPRARALLRRGMTPTQVHLRLAAEGVSAPVWDYFWAGHDDRPRQPGIVSRGMAAGLLGTEWAERQRAAIAGVDAEHD